MRRCISRIEGYCLGEMPNGKRKGLLCPLVPLVAPLEVCLIHLRAYRPGARESLTSVAAQRQCNRVANPANHVCLERQDFPRATVEGLRPEYASIRWPHELNIESRAVGGLTQSSPNDDIRAEWCAAASWRRCRTRHARGGCR